MLSMLLIISGSGTWRGKQVCSNPGMCKDQAHALTHDASLDVRMWDDGARQVGRDQAKHEGFWGP